MYAALRHPLRPYPRVVKTTRDCRGWKFSGINTNADDTVSDSPGTNIVTRIVTITAQVGGSPPLRRQWKVDQGRGFVVIPGATNATFRIGNAQPSDSGHYALFVTNSGGQTNTTPVPLIVIEGVD